MAIILGTSFCYFFDIGGHWRTTPREPWADYWSTTTENQPSEELRLHFDWRKVHYSIGQGILLSDQRVYKFFIFSPELQRES